MLATLGEVRASPVKNIPGVSPLGDQFRDYVNEATQQLMRRGDFSGLLWPIQVVVRKGSITWPRYVGQVRKVNLCNQPLRMDSPWYQFLDRAQNWSSCCGSGCNLRQQGKVATYNDIPGPGWRLLAYPLLHQDAGMNMTIYGVDQNQQPLRHQNGDGSWSDGLILDAADNLFPLPIFASTTQVYRIDRVVRDATKGNVILYAINANNILQDLAVYEPSETNPEYSRSQLNLPCEVDCGTNICVLAMVKLKFIPAVADNDLVLVDNLEALKAYVQSVRFAEAGDDTNAKLYEARAIRSLNLQLADETPLDQIPVEVEPFGAMSFGRQAF